MTALKVGDHLLHLRTVAPGRYDASCECGQWSVRNVERRLASITHASHLDAAVSEEQFDAEVRDASE